MTPKASLFQPAAKRQRYLKVLLHGGPASGKTKAALGFPGPIAVIDLEGGTALYDGFFVLLTRDLKEVMRAVDELAGGGYGTLVIDPLTVVWQLLQQAGQVQVDSRGRPGKDSLESGAALTRREWGIIKRWYATLMTRLTALPLHVVLIARETDLYEEGANDQLKRVGTKANVEKDTSYSVDLELLLTCDRQDGARPRFVATVEKTRLDALPLGKVLTGYDATPAGGLFAKHLAPIAAALAAGPAVEVAPPADESQVAAGNAALLAEAEAPSPDAQKRAAYARRIRELLTGPALALAARERGELANALLDLHPPVALDALLSEQPLDALERLGKALGGFHSRADVDRYWERREAPPVAAGAAEE